MDDAPTSGKLKEEALDYHRQPIAGKISVVATKPLANQHDLSLAYSPGVAFACEAIVEDPLESYNLTARGNLVGVVTNGTAVLGLGAIGPLAAKPVMEGKAGLFKKFAGINVFDIEIEETDTTRLVDIIASLEPTFGGINLEDIKAPECFEVESRLKERMNIPVLHDDQHGTAIIVGAAVVNGLQIVGKDLAEVKLVASGAGAAAIACLDLLVSLGMQKKNILLVDSTGVVHSGRKGLNNPYKARYARETKARTLADAVVGQDIFLGVSVANVLTQEMVKTMADKPIIMALANPDPEILPELVKEVRPDAIIATGRSDYPNQVNNVLCFPFIFRGALDVGATVINGEMKMACVHALADLAQAEADEAVSQAYGGEETSFGPDYLIPRPFDPRLLVKLAPAVARAAMETGVATRPIEDFEAYRQRLLQFVFRSNTVMKPIFDRARRDPRRVVYAEGEDPRVLRAVQNLVDDGMVQPILIGRREVVDQRLKNLGLRLVSGVDFELCDPQQDDRYREYWELYHRLLSRKGVSRDKARATVRTDTTVIAALMVKRGEAEAMICGATRRYVDHLPHVFSIIGLAQGVRRAAAVSMLLVPSGTFFMCDTYVNPNPNAEDVAEVTVLAAAAVRRFGIEPKVALLSHSAFGSSKRPEARKMRDALKLIRKMAPDLEVDGEMHSDAALSQEIRDLLVPDSPLSGQANLLVMPSLDAANIAFHAVRMLTNCVSVGPMLIGMAQPAHVLTESIGTRGIMNMTALAVVEAQSMRGERAGT